MILIIAAREFKNFFLSPLAWTMLAVLQFLFAYLFLIQVDSFLQFQSKLAGIENAPGLTEMIIVPLMGNAAIILLFITPILTMRLISEERRNKTLTLLLSAPLNCSEIILGKYIAVCAFLGTMISLVMLMSLSLAIGGDVDKGQFCSNLLGISLLTATFAAIGLYMSCIANHPLVAGMGSFGILLFLWILDWNAAGLEKHSELFRYLSLANHFRAFQNGLINTADISYFILLTAVFLIFSIRHLEQN